MIKVIKMIKKNIALYSYGYNNPVKYNDPTGHCGAEATADPNDYYYIGYAEYTACIEVRGQLEEILGMSIPGVWTLEQMNILQESIASLGDAYDFANMTAAQIQAAIAEVAIYWASQVTDIEAIIRAIEFAYAIGASPDDVFAALGYEDDGITGFGPWASPTDRTGLGRDVQDALNAQQDYGFHEMWQPDVEEEQIHHLIFWMQVAYYNFTPWASVGNWAHELCNNPACSPEDEALGVWAIQVGDMLANGEISLLDLANLMRASLIYGN
jgi:hypothetical protein